MPVSVPAPESSLSLFCASARLAPSFRAAEKGSSSWISTGSRVSIANKAATMAKPVNSPK